MSIQEACERYAKSVYSEHILAPSCAFKTDRWRALQPAYICVARLDLGVLDTLSLILTSHENGSDT